MRKLGRRLVAGIGISTLLVFAAETAVAKDPAARVTTAVGDVTTGDGRPLAARSAVADDEKVALGKDEGCSLLIDDDALVEMCEETAMVLDTDAESGRRRVRIDAGEIRIIVEPRAEGERIEVHTPAAIATILGTIVHFAVDPTTGETTISSAESRVRVRSSDPAVNGATIVSPLEQIRMRPGQAPPERPRRLEPEEFAALGGCLVDFHALAGELARDEFQLRAAERIATVEAAETPWSSSQPPAAPAMDPAGGILDPAEVCSPSDCGVGEFEAEPSLSVGNDLVDAIDNF